MEENSSNFQNLYRYYLYILFLLIAFYLSSLNSVQSYNAMSEWIITYQGGFVRRGLLGEIFYKISSVLNINFKFSLLVLQTSLYGIFYYLIYKLIKKLKYTKLILFVVFSPIFLFFPLSELEAIGRKEILVNLLLLSMILLTQNNFKRIIIFFIGSIIVLLTHEIIVFYFINFLIFLLIINKTNEKKFNFMILVSFVLLIFFTASLYLNDYTEANKEMMCESLLKEFNIVCGFQAHYIVNEMKTYVGEIFWSPVHFLRNSFIFIFGFGPLFIFSFFTKFNKDICNPIISKIPVIYFLLILSIFNLLIFFISVDTGRYFHLCYTNLFIFIFGLNFLGIIKIDYVKLENLETRIYMKNKYLFFILFLTFSLSWTPKAVYHEDLGSFPYYRTVEKIPNFINNYKDLKFLKSN